MSLDVVRILNQLQISTDKCKGWKNDNYFSVLHLQVLFFVRLQEVRVSSTISRKMEITLTVISFM